MFDKLLGKAAGGILNIGKGVVVGGVKQLGSKVAKSATGALGSTQMSYPSLGRDMVSGGTYGDEEFDKANGKMISVIYTDPHGQRYYWHHTNVMWRKLR